MYSTRKHHRCPTIPLSQRFFRSITPQLPRYNHPPAPPPSRHRQASIPSTHLKNAPRLEVVKPLKKCPSWALKTVVLDRPAHGPRKTARALCGIVQTKEGLHSAHLSSKGKSRCIRQAGPMRLSTHGQRHTERRIAVVISRFVPRTAVHPVRDAPSPARLTRKPLIPQRKRPLGGYS